MQYQTINLSLIKFDSHCFNSSEIQVGNLTCLISQPSKLDCRSHPTTFSHLLRKVVGHRICVFISDYRLVGHVIESLLTDELDCGLRCVRNKKCHFYNVFFLTNTMALKHVNWKIKHDTRSQPTSGQTGDSLTMEKAGNNHCYASDRQTDRHFYLVIKLRVVSSGAKSNLLSTGALSTKIHYLHGKYYIKGTTTSI